MTAKTKRTILAVFCLALLASTAPAQTTDTWEWFRWFNLTNAIRQQTQAIQSLRPPVYYPTTPYLWGPPGYPSGGLGALFLLSRVNYERRLMEEYARRAREIEDYYARQRTETQESYLNAFLKLSPEDLTVFSLLPRPENRIWWLSLSIEDREDLRNDGTLARTLNEGDPENADWWRAIAGVPSTASAGDTAKALRMKIGRDRYGRMIRALVEGNVEAAIFEFAVFYFNAGHYDQARRLFFMVYDHPATDAKTKEEADRYLKLMGERMSEQTKSPPVADARMQRILLELETARLSNYQKKEEPKDIDFDRELTPWEKQEVERQVEDLRKGAESSGRPFDEALIRRAYEFLMKVLPPRYGPKKGPDK